jgi:hypothetical protein
MMMVMVMVMVRMNYHHNLRLRRIGNRETEEEDHAKEYLFHSPSVGPRTWMR